MTRKENPVTLHLKRARKLVEKGWTRGALARDRQGREIHVDSKRACRVCSMGALERALKPTELTYGRAFEALVECLPANYLNVADFNDSCATKRPVLEAFDRAIELSRKATP